MDHQKRKTIEGWVNKASNHLETAKECLKWHTRVSDSIQASQVCVELSVKAVLTMLDIDYPPSHGWNRKQIEDLAEQIQKRGLLGRLAAQHLEHTIRLPRLLFRMNFWSQFYLEAKYGFEAGHLAPAQDLFETEDAQLAVRHAEDCFWAAHCLLHLPPDQFGLLVGG